MSIPTCRGAPPRPSDPLLQAHRFSDRVFATRLQVLALAPKGLAHLLPCTSTSTSLRSHDDTLFLFMVTRLGCQCEQNCDTVFNAGSAKQTERHQKRNESNIDRARERDFSHWSVELSTCLNCQSVKRLCCQDVHGLTCFFISFTPTRSQTSDLSQHSMSNFQFFNVFLFSKTATSGCWSK